MNEEWKPKVGDEVKLPSGNIGHVLEIYKDTLTVLAPGQYIVILQDQCVFVGREEKE